jgi:hypothetical protein
MTVLYVRGVPLRDHVGAGRVQLLTDAGATPVVEPDVRLRVNNRDRIRAERVPLLLSAGIGLGASIVLLLFGVLGWGPVKPPRPAS